MFHTVSTSLTLLQTNACVIPLHVDVASQTQQLCKWPKSNALLLNSDQLATLVSHISAIRKPMKRQTTAHLAQLPQIKAMCCSTRPIIASTLLHVYAEHPQTALAASPHYLPQISHLFAEPQPEFLFKTVNAIRWRQTLQATWTVPALTLQLELTHSSITMR